MNQLILTILLLYITYPSLPLPLHLLTLLTLLLPLHPPSYPPSLHLLTLPYTTLPYISLRYIPTFLHYYSTTYIHTTYYIHCLSYPILSYRESCLCCSLLKNQPYIHTYILAGVDIQNQIRSHHITEGATVLAIYNVYCRPEPGWAVLQVLEEDF